MAAAPVMASETATPMPGSQSSPALFRKMRMNPDGSFTEIGSTPMKEYGSTPFERFAEGGGVSSDNGENRQDVYRPLSTITEMPKTPGVQSPSERAMDFLMGKTNSLKPFYETKSPAPLEKIKPPTVDAIKPPTVVDVGGGLSGGQDFGGLTALDGSYNTGYDVNPYSGSPQALANSPFGYAVGKISNAISGLQTPAPVEDVVGTPVGSDVYEDDSSDRLSFTSPAVSSPVRSGSDMDTTTFGGDAVGGPDGVGGGTLGGAESAADPALNADGGVVGRFASGGLGSLGGYSDGGRLLRGPGDGVSDSIPATIGHGRQPARLASGEFVVPARIVSELGNGSTEAGARALYAMMDRIQKNRRKTVGKGKVAVNSKSTRLLPA